MLNSLTQNWLLLECKEVRWQDIYNWGGSYNKPSIWENVIVEEGILD